MKIAFVSGEIRNLDIEVINSDGTDRINLTSENRGDDYSPVWSPDSQHIVYTSDRDGSSDIWIMDSDGSNLKNLTPGRSGLEDFATFSPDGQSVAFISERQENFFDVWIARIDGTELRNLTENSTYSFSEPSWLPNSNGVVFTSPFPTSNGVWIATLSSTELVQLTAAYPQRSDFNVSVSPTENIAAVADLQTHDLWLIDIDRRMNINITPDTSAVEGNPVWSPDGQQIAFHCGLNLCVVQKDGSGYVNLTQSQDNDYVALNPSWSPDGKRIAFESNRDGDFDIWTMDVNGSDPINLTGHNRE